MCKNQKLYLRMTHTYLQSYVRGRSPSGIHHLVCRLSLPSQAQEQQNQLLCTTDGERSIKKRKLSKNYKESQNRDRRHLDRLDIVA